jgi:hypothetical protein
MRLAPRLLSLLAGSAAATVALGCGGTTQTLPRAAQPTGAVQVASAPSPRVTPNNVSSTTTPGEPVVVTPVSGPVEPYPPEDIPVDCGRG